VVNATPRPLYPREKDPVPIVQKAGWVSGPVWKGPENLFPSEFRTPDCPAHSESLYRLHQFADQHTYKKIQKQKETKPKKSSKDRTRKKKGKNAVELI
jgi:hypothetical protein